MKKILLWGLMVLCAGSTCYAGMTFDAILGRFRETDADSGGVANPMIEDLNAGAFGITNVGTLEMTGNILWAVDGGGSIGALADNRPEDVFVLDDIVAGDDITAGVELSGQRVNAASYFSLGTAWRTFFYSTPNRRELWTLDGDGAGTDIKLNMQPYGTTNMNWYLFDLVYDVAGSFVVTNDGVAALTIDLASAQRAVTIGDGGDLDIIMGSAVGTVLNMRGSDGLMLFGRAGQITEFDGNCRFDNVMTLYMANPLVGLTDWDTGHDDWRIQVEADVFMIDQNVGDASWTTRMTFHADGGASIPSLKTGADQGAAGAAAGELWVDTDDANTIKIGV